LLYKVRGITDRYQEQKYVALASLFVLEVLVIGVPVLVAVQDSPAARYIVMAAIVVLNGKCGRIVKAVSTNLDFMKYVDSSILSIVIDIGILCFVFAPKMRYQKEGLPAGVGVGESINREGMQRAMSRRSQSFTLSSQHGNRLAGTMGQSSSSDASQSDKRTGTDDDEMKSSSHDDGGEVKRWGLGFARNEPNDQSKRSWGSAFFRSSVADNLDSIMEVADETSGALSAQDSSSFKQEGTKEENKINQSDANKKLDAPARAELVGNVKARVQEKLAKRLAQSEQYKASALECAPVDENTALAVGGNDSLDHNSGDGSGEFHSPATQVRLMNRLGAKEKP